MAVTFSPAHNALMWSHFRKVGSSPDGSSSYAHTGPNYDLAIPNQGGVVKDGNNLKVTNVTIKVSLNAVNTWVIKNQETDDLLAHERRHWMMDIIIGHELERAILTLSGPNPNTLKQKVQAEFDWHRNRREKWLADKYDDETKHGTDQTAQSQWNTKVDQWFLTKSILLRTPR
jgi:hypothetical protein